jgi:hypothetical protein
MRAARIMRSALLVYCCGLLPACAGRQASSSQGHRIAEAIERLKREVKEKGRNGWIC